MTEQNSSQAENSSEDFKALLDAYGYANFQVARGLAYDDSAEEQAVLDYVAKLEARQMPTDFDEMYALYQRDEERGDPELRDMRFAGYAAAFFTRFLRMVDPDWK